VIVPCIGRAAADDSGRTRVEFDHQAEDLEIPPATKAVRIQIDTSGKVWLYTPWDRET